MREDQDRPSTATRASGREDAMRLLSERYKNDEPCRAFAELSSDPMFCFEYETPIAIDLPPDEQIARMLQGILIVCNEAYAVLYRAESPEDIIGKRFTDMYSIVHRDNTAMLRAFIADGHVSVDAESRVVTHDGREFYFVRNARGIIENGRLVRVWGIWRDVTARYRAAERLRQSEARLKEAQRLAKIGSWEINDETSQFTWSDEFFRILDIEPEHGEASTETFLERVHPDDRAKVRSTFCMCRNSSEPYSFEHRLLMDDGSIKYVSKHCENIFDEQGTRIRAIGTLEDITERKESEAIIEELMARLEALAAVTFDGIAMSDNDVLIECSPQLADALGYSTHDIESQTMLSFIAPAYRLSAQRNMAADAVRPFETRMLRKDGTTLPVEMVRATITIKGRKLCVYGIRDISRRKELQNEVVAVSEDERHRIGRDLHDSVGQLLFGASLSLASLRDEVADSSPSLLPKLKHIEQVIGDAIDETRRVSHLLVPTIQDRNHLGAALAKLVATFNGLSSIHFTAECDYRSEIADEKIAEQLYRITQEGISNALRHSRASEATVRLYERDRLLHLEIADNGIGISPKQAGCDAGLGIRSMRYRANLIDASIQITSGDGNNGTRILCTCPLDS